MSRNFQHTKVLSHIHVQLELGYCKSVLDFVSTASLLEISFHPQTANLSCSLHKTRNNFSCANTAQLFVKSTRRRRIRRKTGQIRPQAMLFTLHFVLVEFSTHQSNKQASHCATFVQALQTLVFSKPDALTRGQRPRRGKIGP
jgi:hypothetical protein